MKPLLKTDIKSFLERFESFKDAEFRSIYINSPFNITLTFAVQDAGRDFDWITIKLEFEGVSNASLIEESKLEYVDMSDGINITHNGTSFALKIINSTCHIESSSLKYEEGLF